MIRCAAFALMISAGFASGQTLTNQGTGAVLRGLDKVSGQTSDISLQAGQGARFGRLTVALRECRFPQGNPSGDAYASIQIVESGKEEAVFDGWMIASAPALSAVDHARYDVWVIRCTTS